MTLIKLNQMSWMNKICDDFAPGLEIQDDNNQNVEVSAPVEETQSRYESKSPPVRSVSNAPSYRLSPKLTNKT